MCVRSIASVVFDSLQFCGFSPLGSPSVGFSRQEYWSGLPGPPGDLPDPRIKHESPVLQVDYVPTETPGKPDIMYANYNSVQFNRSVVSDSL